MKSTNQLNLNESEVLKSVSQEMHKKPKLFLLEGEVGSGKTTISKYILNTFYKVKTTSPTFGIVNEFKVDTYKVAHIDCYRLSNSITDKAMIADYLDNFDFLIIEWSSLLDESMQKKISHIPFLKVELQITDFDKRNLKLTSNLC